MTKFTQDEAGYKEKATVYPCLICDFWIPPGGAGKPRVDAAGKPTPGPGDCKAIENTPGQITWDASCGLWVLNGSPTVRTVLGGEAPSKENPPLRLRFPPGPAAIRLFAGLSPPPFGTPGFSAFYRLLTRRALSRKSISEPKT